MDYNEYQSAKWYVCTITIAAISFILGIFIGCTLLELDYSSSLTKMLYTNTNDYLQHQNDSYESLLKEVELRLRKR